jgi:gliding motility-associated-like protein
MFTNKRFVSVLIFLLCGLLSYAQVPSRFYFYSGDSLKGLDLTNLYKEMLLYAHENGLSESERLLYLMGHESQYVEKKYGFKKPEKQTKKVLPIVTAICNNLGFETGDFTGWTGGVGYNFNSTAPLTITNPIISTRGLDYPEPLCSFHTLVNAAAGTDPYGSFAMLDPGGGTYALRLGGEYINLAGPNTASDPADSCVSGTKIGGTYYAGGEMIQQTFVVTKANAMFSYNYAVVLDKALHKGGECPYFRAEVLDSAGNPIPCLQYYVQSDSSNTPAGMVLSPKKNGFGGPVFYLNWTNNSLNLKNYIGHNVTVRFTAAGCTHGGHRGYAYIDAFCGPIEIIASSPPVCLGGTISLTAPGAGAAGTFSWSTVPAGGPGIVGSTTSQTVTVNVSGTYEVTVTQAPGCFYKVDTTISFFPNPTVTMTSTPPSCNPGNDGTATATITGGTAPYTYTWTPAPATGQGTLTASGLSPGTYSVSVSTANGCTATGSVTLAAPAPAPAITVSNTPASCSPGKDGTATATVTGGITPYTYSWTGGVIGGGQGTASVSGLGAGTYTLTVTAPGACPASQTTTVTQPPGAPTVTLSNTPASCSPGADGTATATVTGGTTPYTYSWTGGTIPTGQGTNSISGLAAGTYTLTVQTPGGACPTVTTTTITQPVAPLTSSTNTNVSCFGLSDGTATATSTGGSAPLTYSWNPNVSASSSVTGLPAGTYTCTTSDSKGCMVKTTVTVTQPALLTVNATGIPATCNGKCNGQIIGLPAGGTASYTYSWSGGCAAASCNTVCAGTYTATITDSHGCVATDTALVKQPTPIVLSMTPKPSHCSKPDGSDSVSASGGTPGYTYSWTPGANTMAFYNHILAGPYTVYVKDNNGCLDSSSNVVPNLPGVNLVNVASTPVTCFGGSDGTARDSASGGFKPYSYVWTPAPGVGQGTASVSGLPVGTYTCVVTDSAGCKNQSTVTIVQPTKLTVQAGPPVTLCIGQCTDLSAVAAGGSPAYTYNWTYQGGPLASTHVCPTASPNTYTVTVTDSHGCVSTPSTTTVILNPPLEAVASADKSICPGASATLQGSASGGNGGPYTYLWIPATGLSSTTIPNPVATPSVTTTYTVIVADNCGTPTDSAMTTVTLYPNPVAIFTASDTVGCAPICINFTGKSVPACASATWNFGDNSPLGTGCGNVRHCYAAAGTYNVTYNVIDVDGCKGTYTQSNFVNALPRPEAAFTASPQPTTIINPNIHFTDQSTSATPITWAWTFGDVGNATSTLQNPKFSYPDTGCYNVLLIVTSANGCTDSVMNPVCIRPEFTFYAPNTFTPNGDGKNDVWMPYGIGIDINNYDLIMFDRWGNLMFETHTWGEGWDGRANHGTGIAQIDTYVWKVNLKDVFGIKHSYIGHCNIIK